MRRLVLLTLAAALALAIAAHAAATHCSLQWVGSFAASPTVASGPALSNQTVRMAITPREAGKLLRIHVSNKFGTEPIEVGPMTIGETADGAAVKPRTLHSITFDGDGAAVTIQPGKELVSDSVQMDVKPGTDLTVSIDVPFTIDHPTGYQSGVTSFLSSAGEHAAEEDGANYHSADRGYFLTGIDVGRQKCVKPHKRKKKVKLFLSVGPRLFYTNRPTVLGFYVSHKTGPFVPPAPHARVTFLGRHARTDKDGYVSMHLVVHRPGRYIARAKWHGGHAKQAIRVKPGQ